MDPVIESTIRMLLVRARAAGLTVAKSCDGRLVVRGKDDAWPLVEEIGRNKEAVMVFLASERTRPPVEADLDCPEPPRGVWLVELEKLRQKLRPK